MSTSGIGEARTPRLFAVHTTRPDEGAGAIEVVFIDERSARAYARSR